VGQGPVEIEQVAGGKAGRVEDYSDELFEGRADFGGPIAHGLCGH
jgi:hypothetical protein